MDTGAVWIYCGWPGLQVLIQVHASKDPNWSYGPPGHRLSKALLNWQVEQMSDEYFRMVNVASDDIKLILKSLLTNSIDQRDKPGDDSRANGPYQRQYSTLFKHLRSGPDKWNVLCSRNNPKGAVADP